MRDASVEILPSYLEGAGPGVQGNQQRQHPLLSQGPRIRRRRRHDTPCQALDRALEKVGRLRVHRVHPFRSRKAATRRGIYIPSSAATMQCARTFPVRSDKSATSVLRSLSIIPRRRE